MHMNRPNLPYRCKECKSDKNHPRIADRLVFTVCNDCGHEAMTDILPEPKPEVTLPEIFKMPTHREF